MLLAALLTAATLAVPAHAAPAPPPVDHAMGSTLAAHEPGVARQQKSAGIAAAAVGPWGTPGIDVSHWQNTVDWNGVAASGKKFTYIKASESTDYLDPQFGANYAGSLNAGLFRGAYHFARPDQASGAAQANFFADHGGGWQADGRTLPPVLDIEYNPSGDTCYGMAGGPMVAWVNDFLTTMRARTGRWPVIYTTRGWWRLCTGNDSSLAQKSPLWIAGYNGDPINLPNGWGSHSMWQHAVVNNVDQNVFNGGLDELRAFVNGDEADIINSHYNQLGGAGNLGAPSGARYAVGAGSAQDYANGTIYFTPGTGAWSVRGSILTYYKQAGGPAGFLGFPGYDEATAANGGRYGHFQFGSVFSSTSTGTHEVHGGIRVKYAALGWDAGYLGFPTSDEQDVPTHSGRYNNFQGGAIYYANATGTSSAITGGIRAKWQALGADGSYLGLPISDELDTPRHVGRYNDFQGGSIYYNFATSTSSAITGGIRAKWLGLGGDGSYLGLPTSDELDTANRTGRYNTFQSGAIYYVHATGTSSAITGGIRAKWQALGGDTSYLGLPVTDELDTTNFSGRFNHFQNGSIYYSHATGNSVAITGGIRGKWWALGAENSYLGLPITDELDTSNRSGRYNNFQNGSIYYNKATGNSVAITGGIRARWYQLGAETSYLGLPISDEYSIPGGRRSDFQGGYVVYDAATWQSVDHRY